MGTTVGFRMQIAAASAGLSADDIARQCLVPETLVTKWFTDEEAPKGFRLNLFCRSTNQSRAYILYNNTQMKKVKLAYVSEKDLLDSFRPSLIVEPSKVQSGHIDTLIEANLDETTSDFAEKKIYAF